MLAKYEEQLYSHIEQNAPAVFDSLKEKESIDDTLEELMKNTLTAFGDSFKASKGLN